MNLENEPRKLYLVCYELKETDPDYLPVNNDFDSLEGENILWSPNECEGMHNIEYVSMSEIESMATANPKMSASDLVKELKKLL